MTKKILIIGNPNVGKSVIFTELTGIYVTVSNYPGTTVEITSGNLLLNDQTIEVIDTPGLYSLVPITAEEKVTRQILFANPDCLVLQVVDARNLTRMLPLTFQLIRAGFHLVLAVNMLDESRREGYHLNLSILGQRLGIPVVGTVATRGEGIDQLKEVLTQVWKGHLNPRSAFRPQIDQVLQEKAQIISAQLHSSYSITKESLALLLLRGDTELRQLVQKKEGPSRWRQIVTHLISVSGLYDWGPSYQLAVDEHAAAEKVLVGILTRRSPETQRWQERLAQLTVAPWSGFLILLAVVYCGLYLFVGRFGAGTLVDWLDQHLFQGLLIPACTALVAAILPSQFWQSLFIGPYGIVTLGVRYAIAIILPIVGSFFFFFSLLEDSGYLPRLALLMDRGCKKLGLNGRAVIPLVLGLGCDTMATLTTRILETKRERFIATFLLALAIPCSAQLGVILALLSPYPGAVLLWMAMVLFTFILAGHLLNRYLPGQVPLFFLEVPPLRWPRLSNILIKTYSRMQWYFLEIFPVFLGISVVIWLGEQTGIFQSILGLFRPLVSALGLPPETAVAFFFGFFRRDYGAAGLFDLARSGILGLRNLVTAAVTLTLFLPCIAQFAVMWKERGPLLTLFTVAVIIPVAFMAGFLVNLLLLLFNV